LGQLGVGRCVNEIELRGCDMGRTCRICRRDRPNEQFGGKGYAASVCKKCRKRPKSEQQRILATDEVFGFLLEQSNISAKNIKRLETLVTIDDARFQRIRALVFEIARVKPHRRRRWSFLRTQHPVLYRQAIDAGLVEDFKFDESPEFATDIDCDSEIGDFDTSHSDSAIWDNSGEHF